MEILKIDFYDIITIVLFYNNYIIFQMLMHLDLQISLP